LSAEVSWSRFGVARLTEMNGDQLIGAVLALADTPLRRDYLHSLWLATRAEPWALPSAKKPEEVAAAQQKALADLAYAFDSVCARADAAEPRAEEALRSLVDALFVERSNMAANLRSAARTYQLSNLERLVRYLRPLKTRIPDASVAVAAPLQSERPGAGGRSNEPGVPDYGKGRPLALGERKALARKPTRVLMDRLLCDPHPDVIRSLLGNCRITEDDVVKMASKRQRNPEVLVAIAESPKWLRSRRVGVALACNPDAPIDIGTRVVRLLLRPDLEMLASSPKVPNEVRQICLELLQRRPPAWGPAGPEPGNIH
jgi:hypothetical protein